jgi:hypothetical protein
VDVAHSTAGTLEQPLGVGQACTLLEAEEDLVGSRQDRADGARLGVIAHTASPWDPLSQIERR